MNRATLSPIRADGLAGGFLGELPELAVSFIECTSEMYGQRRFVPPWIGYLAARNSTVAGTCGFKSPPQSNSVEIAYFTFPGNEGNGIATAMATSLVEIALSEAPHIRPTAQTLVPRNASHRVLEKVGFVAHSTSENTLRMVSFWFGIAAPNLVCTQGRSAPPTYLATPASIGTILRSLDVVRFVKGGVVVAFRCAKQRMPNTDRRKLLRVGLAFVALPSTMLHLGCSPARDSAQSETDGSPTDQATGNEDRTEATSKGISMQIQYLEIVTPDVDAVCQTYSTLHGVTFKAADPSLGGARTAKLAGGGMLGIRAPMRDTEDPVVRPYVLVDNIQAAIDAAAEAGAEVAMPPTEIPGHGTFAIFIQGGLESGLWQL